MPEVPSANATNGVAEFRSRAQRLSCYGRVSAAALVLLFTSVGWLGDAAAVSRDGVAWCSVFTLALALAGIAAAMLIVGW